MRRRRKVNWFPTLGTNLGEDVSELAGQAFFLPVNDNGTQSLGIFPVTFDSPQDETNVAGGDTPLVNIVGSEYILKRLVGKCHLGLYQQSSSQVIPEAVLIGCGFFVARAEDTPNQAAPVGAATEGDLQKFDNYSPLAKKAIREPWIWRRTTILGTYGIPRTRSAPNEVYPGDAYPPSNALLSGLGDGPHFDAKSARRVGNDDRLWFAVAAMNWPPGDVFQGQSHEVQGYLDLRILGSLVKAHNRSTF